MSIDLGTGDGLFPYHSARTNQDRLYIGIDPNARPLERISEKACRKASKGGAPNLVYLLASAESLPPELNGVAQEVFVLYPWGSLLKGVLAPEHEIIRSLRRICCGTLRIAVAIDPVRDHGELQRLDLQRNPEPIAIYEQLGFSFVDAAPFPCDTTWSRKLGQNRNRETLYLTFAAGGSGD